MSSEHTREEPPLSAARRSGAAPDPRPARPGLLLRAKTSPRVRRLVPARLAVARGVAVGRAAWRTGPTERAEALEAMRIVLGEGTGEALLERAAEQHLIESMATRALFWQPWDPPLLDEPSRARLRGALDSGRGVVLSICHLGPHFRLGWAVRAMGRELHTVYGPWFFEPPTPDMWGRRLERWRRGAAGRPLPAPGSFAALAELLGRGGIALLALDVPGHRETRFLGKPCELADGSARLAALTGSVVLPLRARREGHRVWADVAEPLDGRERPDTGELHERLARVHERWILERPGAMEDPRHRGWGNGASPSAWRRP